MKNGKNPSALAVGAPSGIRTRGDRSGMISSSRNQTFFKSFFRLIVVGFLYKIYV